VRERLVECAGGGRLTCGGETVPDDLIRRPGLVRVMGQSGQLDVRVPGERGENLPVVGHACGGRELLLDGAAGQLVAEPDMRRVGLEDAAALGLVERLGAIAEQALDEPALDLAGNRGEQFERPPGVAPELPEPGEPRVTDRRRHLHVRAGQDLGHEEGVAARGVEHRVRVRTTGGTRQAR
jgi:hypothetical protein